MQKEKTSVTRKEFEKHITVCNNKRCIKSSAALGLAFLLMMAIYKPLGIGMNAKALMGFGIAFEVVQLLTFAVSMYLQKNNEFDKMVVLYRTYYASSLMLLLLLGAVDVKVNASIILIAAAICFYVFIPILSANELKVFSGLLLLATVAMSFYLHKLGTRFVIDSIVLLLAGVIAGKYHSEMLRKHEKLLDELKKKTISAEQDPLTGLTNRRGLGRRANTIWPYCARTGNSVGIIALDIDFFKKYNDKYGHPEGDKCLVKIADAIRNSARRGTDISARIGGEEFLVFVQDMSQEEIIDLALKIRKNIADLKIPHAFVGVSQYVTVSMGVAVTQPSALNNFHDLYEEADQALYTAKENGRNCVVCKDVIYGRLRNGLGRVISL